MFHSHSSLYPPPYSPKSRSETGPRGSSRKSRRDGATLLSLNSCSAVSPSRTSLSRCLSHTSVLHSRLEPSRSPPPEPRRCTTTVGSEPRDGLGAATTGSSSRRRRSGGNRCRTCCTRFAARRCESRRRRRNRRRGAIRATEGPTLVRPSVFGGRFGVRISSPERGSPIAVALERERERPIMSSAGGKLNTSSSELDLDRPNIEDYLPSGTSIQEPHGKLRLRDLLDISPTLTEAAGAIVDDSFTRCFKSNPPEPWNWNIYLFPLWCLGVVVRYGILFPVRVIVLTVGWIIFLSSFIPVHFLLKGHDKLRKKLERCLVELICSFFVASWTGVVKYHGPRPSMRPKQVFVANHTSMIDFIILEQMTAFAVIMQKHPGWVGLLQSTILESLGCIWFNRSEEKDREIVARKLRNHVQGADNNPLLIFPEGTCVNNHYTVMFKKGAFELGCTVCPVAIKYNKIFVDAFWNSRK